MTHAVYVACLLENTIRESERESARAREREINLQCSLGLSYIKNIGQLKAAIFKVFVDEELREAQ